MTTKNYCVTALIGSRHQSLFWQGSSGRHHFVTILEGLNGIISDWFTNNCHGQNLNTTRIHHWCQSHTLCQPQFPSWTVFIHTNAANRITRPEGWGETNDANHHHQDWSFPWHLGRGLYFCSREHRFHWVMLPMVLKYLNRARKSNNFRWWLIHRFLLIEWTNT